MSNEILKERRICTSRNKNQIPYPIHIKKYSQINYLKNLAKNRRLFKSKIIHNSYVSISNLPNINQRNVKIKSQISSKYTLIKDRNPNKTTLSNKIENLRNSNECKNQAPFQYPKSSTRKQNKIILNCKTQKSRKDILEKEYSKVLQGSPLNEIIHNNNNNILAEYDLYNFIYKPATSNQKFIEKVRKSTRNDSVNNGQTIGIFKTSDFADEITKIENLSKLNISARYELMKVNNQILDFLLVLIIRTKIDIVLKINCLKLRIC